MSLIVNNVVNASSKINYSYLSESEIFGYLITLTYSIRVQDVNFDNDDGVLLSGRSALRAAYKRRNITARIAGDEILHGLIKSMSFPQGSLNGEETVNLIIEERRRLDDYSSTTFAKYIPSPHLLSNFEENYSFERSGDAYSYTRNTSIQYAQDVGSQFLNNAKSFLTSYYYENRPEIGYYEDGISENARFNKSFNGLLKQSIDLVNLNVGLTETFSSSFIDEDSDVSKIIKTSESVDERGYLNKTLNVSLTSLKLDSSNVLQREMASVIDEIITTEKSNGFAEPSLIQKGISKDARSAELSITFSTDPKMSISNSVTYSCEKIKEGRFVNYNLSSTYKSIGKNIQEKYKNTYKTWESAKLNNKSKVTALFSEATNIYEKGRSCNIQKSTGIIQENINYTTQDSYDSSSLPDGILKYNIQVSKREKVPRTSKVLDITNLKQKLITSSLDSLGQASVTIVAVSSPEYGIFHGKDFLNGKTDDMNSALEEDNYYGTSDQISIDLANSTTTRVINYIIA
jgi:hypothetical protein